MNIRHNWIAHHRDDDDELLGYLAPADNAPNSFQPMTLFGYPMASPMDFADAQNVLDDLGLSYLAERWYLTLEGRADPIAVTIVEISAKQMTVHNADYGYDGNIGDPFILQAGETSRLSRTR